jgi:hypothetical protein
MAQIKHSDFGFRLEGIEPIHDPAWTAAPDRARRAYWTEAAAFGLRTRQRGIIRGLGANGQPVRNILPSTRKRRRSAMTKSGKGSPSAAPLVPGYTLSRTHQYLRAIVQRDGVWFQWRHDPRTGVNWGQILQYQAEQGRDHFGFSAEEWDAIVTHMDAWWARRRPRYAPVEPAAPVVPIRVYRPAPIQPTRIKPARIVAMPAGGVYTAGPSSSGGSSPFSDLTHFSGFRQFR